MTKKAIQPPSYKIPGTNRTAPITKNVPEEHQDYVANLVMNNIKDIQKYRNRTDITIDDRTEIESRTVAYLQNCVDTHRYPTVTGLAVGIGIDRSTFYLWQKTKPDHPTVKYLKEIQSIMAENLEQAALSNKVNPVTSIFLLKSTHGYKEASETTIIHKNELGAAKSEEQISQEIDQDIIDVDYEEQD